jgi:hypothetical protein
MIRYDFWYEAILEAYGSARIWQREKHFGFLDQHIENNIDLIGCYCMGGEL